MFKLLLHKKHTESSKKCCYYETYSSFQKHKRLPQNRTQTLTLYIRTIFCPLSLGLVGFVATVSNRLIAVLKRNEMEVQTIFDHKDGDIMR